MTMLNPIQFGPTNPSVSFLDGSVWLEINYATMECCSRCFLSTDLNESLQQLLGLNRRYHATMSSHCPRSLHLDSAVLQHIYTIHSLVYPYADMQLNSGPLHHSSNRNHRHFVVERSYFLVSILDSNRYFHQFCCLPAVSSLVSGPIDALQALGWPFP